MNKERDYRQSSFRENLLEHVFIAELLQEMWVRRERVVDVLRSEVDGSGYDVVLECDGVTRHVQLKSTRVGGKAAQVNVNTALARKPAGCVVWMFFQEDTETARLKLDYRFFGAGPREPLPSLDSFKMGRYTKGDATGRKLPRPSIRVVPIGRFRHVNGGITELVDALFGPLPQVKAAETKEKSAAASFATPGARTPASFHDSCIERVESRLGRPLIKKSKGMYASDDGSLTVVCAVSKEYGGGTRPYYWWSIYQSQRHALLRAQKAYIAFGCESERCVLLIPLERFDTWLDGLNVTGTPDSRSFRWHIRIVPEEGKFMLRRKEGFDPIDVTECLLS